MSEKQRAQYFEWDGTRIKGKKPIPRSFFKNKYDIPLNPQIEDLKDYLAIGILNKSNKIVATIKSNDLLPGPNNIHEQRKEGLKYYLCSKDGDKHIPIVINPQNVNKPRYYVIKGQDIYSGNLREFQRGLVMDKIKECFKPFVEILPVITEYPIRIECEIHDTVKNFYDRTKTDLGIHWDVDNYAFPYMKAFPDLLFAMKKIADDDRLHLTQPPVPIFCPIDNHEDRKLVFIISKDEREIIKNHPAYQANRYKVPFNPEGGIMKEIDKANENPY